MIRMGAAERPLLDNGFCDQAERFTALPSRWCRDPDIFVIGRGEDGTLRGFYNVCRHRAHRPLDGTGCRRRITSPDHAWTYDNDGRFARACGAEQMAGLDPRSCPG